MTLGLNPPAEYPSYARQHCLIGGGVFAAALGVTFGTVMAISANHEKHYNSDTCTAFRASAEAQVMRDVEGPSTVNKEEPVVIIDGWHCKLR